MLIALAIGVGFLAGGSLATFERLRVHWWGFALIGLRVPGARVGDRRRARPGGPVHARSSSYALLLAFLWVNRWIPGAR